MLTTPLTTSVTSAAARHDIVDALEQAGVRCTWDDELDDVFDIPRNVTRLARLRSSRLSARSWSRRAVVRPPVKADVDQQCRCRPVCAPGVGIRAERIVAAAAGLIADAVLAARPSTRADALARRRRLLDKAEVTGWSPVSPTRPENPRSHVGFVAPDVAKQPAPATRSKRRIPKILPNIAARIVRRTRSPPDGPAGCFDAGPRLLAGAQRLGCQGSPAVISLRRSRAPWLSAGFSTASRGAGLVPGRGGRAASW
jgi:hypothetical protein